jgi:hypothetical protein
MRILINVLAKHIKASRRLEKESEPFISAFKTDNSCPIALAVKDTFTTDSVTVSETNVVVNALYYDLPRSAQRFIQKFDSYKFENVKPVKPFKFFLTLVEDKG